MDFDSDMVELGISIGNSNLMKIGVWFSVSFQINLRCVYEWNGRFGNGLAADIDEFGCIV
jgi:hypothetical protein